MFKVSVPTNASLRLMSWYVADVPMKLLSNRT